MPPPIATTRGPCLSYRTLLEDDVCQAIDAFRQEIVATDRIVCRIPMTYEDRAEQRDDEAQDHRGDLGQRAKCG